MLKSKLFWAFNLLFFTFAVLVAWSAISVYKSHEEIILKRVIEGKHKTMKYVYKAIHTGNYERLKKEAEEHGFEFVCINEECQIPSGFEFVFAVEDESGDLLVYSDMIGNFFVLMKSESYKLGLMLKPTEEMSQKREIFQLFSLMVLMFATYVLALVGLRQNLQIKRMHEASEEMLNVVSHEVKTPLSKAKFATQMLPDSDKKEIIKKALRTIDELSSDILKSRSLSAKNYTDVTAFDVAKQAKEALFNDERVDVHLLNNFDLYINFDAVVIAVKNLAQNGIMHSVNGVCKIIVDNNQIMVCSAGDKIEESLEELCGEFIKKEHSRGFGLGLYIVNQVAKNNRLKFTLKCEKGFNVFSLAKY